MAAIHIPDGTLAAVFNKLIDFDTDALVCVLIDISTYNRVTDTVLSDLTQITGTGYTAGGKALMSTVIATDTTNHKTTVTFTPDSWASSTISATGAAIIDTTAGNRILAVDDFAGTVSSTSGTFSVAPIVVEFTHF
jgi:hypothetical protein